jgi:hypothetical protein
MRRREMYSRIPIVAIAALIGCICQFFRLPFYTALIFALTGQFVLTVFWKG